jgi:superfamily II DNA/RNA helicase
LDVEKIFGHVRKNAGKTQNIMFSATIPPWVIEIANSYFEKVVKINLIKDQDVRTS